MTTQADRAQPAEPHKTYPAWTDSRRRTLHAVTNQPAGIPLRSGYLALCGKSVRWPAKPLFDVDNEQSCLACSVAILKAQAVA